MREGSKITGNINNSASGDNARSGAVRMENGTTFIMEGGEITGNSVTATLSISSGGVYVGIGAKLIMKGGTIKGNKGPVPDVLVHSNDIGAGSGSGDIDRSARFALSGDATIGALVLSTSATAANRRYGVAVHKDWSGKVENLFFRAVDDTSTNPLETWVTEGAKEDNPARVVAGWDGPYEAPNAYVDAAPAAGIVAKFLKLKTWTQTGTGNTATADVLDGNDLSSVPDLSGYEINAEGKLVAK